MKQKAKKPSGTEPVPQQQDSSKVQKVKPDFPEQVRSFVSEWSVTIILLLFGTTTILQAFVVPTGSMEDTVLIGDHMFVDKLAFSPPGAISKYLLPYTPIKRGDIIVFKWPVDPRQNYIKRVIGVPGDHIKLINKELVLNGKKMTEPYVVHKMNYLDSYRDNFPSEPNMRLEAGAVKMLSENMKDGEIVVPPNCYFAMGDNRDNSLDSRYWGFVPRDNIVGKPAIIFWSYDATTEALADPNIISLNHLIDLATHFFSKTRWNRTLMVPRPYPLG
ncbi:signal peptidase I [Paludibaculum fermentans]|uniref:Signal peptidase I n=1 Tax=Paludibaculum fermentans TaxID=1473598 RepID=A0A7S7NP57_PALFE|nr:signal peptidase I [Paludibaculum fermentans]QOY87222.1 signal peptidase I [Paludibaculum fermentans]